jgi:HEPN domain-containing protein
MRKEAEAWLKISAEDLQSAEVLSDRKLFRPACYHAQQSVEKSLKALIVDRDFEIPRTHNILDLNNTAKQLGYSLEVTDEDAVFLSSVYRARYPSDAGLLPLGEPLEQDAERALNIAQGMARWMKKQV